MNSTEVNNKHYCYHAYANLLQRLGRYQESKQKWCKTINAYRNAETDNPNIADTLFYIYYGSICHVIFKDYQTAEQLYLKAKEKDPENHLTYLSLARLYLEQKDNTIGDTDDDRSKRNIANYKAWEAYRKTEKLIQKDKREKLEIQALQDLAELYLLFEQYEDADECLQIILQKDKKDINANINTGVLMLNQKKYKDAIKYFRNVLDQDHDDLDTRSKLARAYHKQGRNHEAENEYQKILMTVNGDHIDSLIGLSDVYISLADQANKKGNSGDAIVYYDKAIHYLNRLLKYTEPVEIDVQNITKKPEIKDRACQAAKVLYLDELLSCNLTSFLKESNSRNLSIREISSIYYSLGYAKTKYSEANKHKDLKLLQVAQTHFSNVLLGTVNHFNAKRAYNKIKDLLDSLNRASSNTETLFVSILALVVFVFTQIAFFIGSPDIDYAQFTVNEMVLDNYLTEKNIDKSQHKTSIDRLKSGSFLYRWEIISILNMIIDDKQSSTLLPNGLIETDGNLQFKGFKQEIDDVSYGLLTFGAMIFMVAGLFLREITKLKFGAVELEKTTMDQVSISTSLDITTNIRQDRIADQSRATTPFRERVSGFEPRLKVDSEAPEIKRNP